MHDNIQAAQRKGWEWLCRIGSLKFALFNLFALFLGVALGYAVAGTAVWSLTIPLALSAINLLAAIITNGVFRRQLPLLVFHLALLALILLVAVGRLMYLKGQVEVLQGEAFDASLMARDAGPWHWDRLDRVHFINEGFMIDYAPGMRRGPTRNAVRYIDEAGMERRMVIGDSDPLTLHGYRFYTSFNKGFALVFLWQPKGMPQAVLGAVHLPSYPLHEYRQAQEWSLPGTSTKAWMMLKFDENLIDPEKADSFKLPEKHVLVLRIGERRWELQPGDVVELPEGRLVYDSLRSWMGYTVFSDWTIFWLLAAAVLATLSLGWHYWAKFAARPWNTEKQEHA